MVAHIFTAVLAILVILSIWKKKFHLVFFPCMIFLPEYYGLTISPTLPVISVLRILYAIFYLYVLITYRKNLNVGLLKRCFKPSSLLILGYFLLRIISNLYYVTTYSQAIKTILVLILEQAALFIAILIMDPDKETINKSIKSIVYVSIIFFILGISESLTSIRVTDYLYTVNKYIINAHYERLGLLRSTSTFLLPGFYANFCVLVLPLIMYLYNIEKKKYYLGIVALDILAAIHSGARASWFFIIAVLVMFFTLYIRDSKRLIEYIRNAAVTVLILIVIMGILSFISPRYMHYYIGSGKSLLNEVGFEFDLDEDTPNGTVSYGANQDGTYSRVAQFSGIKYSLGINPLFGLGSGAQNRGDIKYFYKGKWRSFKTFDVGYVEVLCSEGIIGFVGYVLLFVSLIYMVLKKSEKQIKSLNIIMIITYLMCLLATINMYSFLWLYIILLYQKETEVN